MADSLDDFFAKKDKKRGKDKGKTVFSAEALVRELEEGSKQAEYPVRKDKTSAAIELLGLDADDADWRDFEDVEKRDYTGLKVKEMSLQDQTEDEQRRLNSEQSDPLPESTPWKMKDEPSSATTESASSAKPKASDKVPDSTKSDAKPVSSSTDLQQQEQKKTEEQQEQQSGTKTTATTTKTSQDSSNSAEKKGDNESAKPVYVPPGGRGGTLSSGSSEVKQLLPQRLGKNPKSSGSRGYEPTPNIQNEKDFPSLG